MIRQWLEERKFRTYKQKTIDHFRRFDRDLADLGDMHKRDLLTDKEYDKRFKEIQKTSEENYAALRSSLDSKPRLTDVPQIRIAIEILAWIAIFVAIAFLLHPSWVERNPSETFIVASVAGLGSTYLRNM